jgi:hypothetical protein
VTTLHQRLPFIYIYTADANFQGDINDGSNSRPYKTYKLTGKIQVNSGATLTIPAGTTIEGTGGTSYIAIAQGGKNNVELLLNLL